MTMHDNCGQPFEERRASRRNYGSARKQSFITTLTTGLISEVSASDNDGITNLIHFSTSASLPLVLLDTTML